MRSQPSTARQRTQPARAPMEPNGSAKDGSVVGTDPFLTFPQVGPEQRCVLETNSELGRFLVRRHLGSGGLGDVYLARDALRDADVAIKVAKLAPGDSAAAEHLHQELQASEGILDHRHVVKHFDLHEMPWGGSRLVALSMEYADGGDLQRWLEEQRDALACRRQHALEYVHQIALGVAALHQAGHLHLDIKPSNVLFVNGSLKVSDFGTSSSTQRLQAGQDPASRQSAGTPAFRSPRHRAAWPGPGAESEDIYGLGVLYYVMCSRSALPPTAVDLAALHNGRTAMGIADLQGVDRAEVDILRQCLAADPSQRYQSVGQLLGNVESRLHRALETEAHQVEIDAIWQGACRFFQQSRFKQAGEACEKVLAGQPDHAGATAMRTAVSDRHHKAADIYATLDKGMEAWDLDLLVSLLQEAVRVYPDHPGGQTVRARLSAKTGQYRQAMEEAKSAVRRVDWDAAGHWFALAKKLNPGSKAVEEANCLTSQVLGQLQRYRGLISQAIAAGNGQRAMQLARNADGYQQQMSRRFLSRGER